MQTARLSREQLFENVHAKTDYDPFAARYSDEQALVDALLRKASEARLSAHKFFEFVWREEHEQRPIVCAPHQRVFFKFVEFYPRCVVRMPVGFSKTYCMSALTTRRLGEDPTGRGLVISESESQAKKPLGMVKAYIENSPELRLVYPELRPTVRSSEAWTQTAITVDRPAGIRDPSLIAAGVGSQKLPGSRLKWFMVDDILSQANCHDAEFRRRTKEFLKNTVFTRRDVRGSRIVVTNTPWDPDDATYWLESMGWPTLTMDAYGSLFFSNADEFDCEEIRPSLTGDHLPGMKPGDPPLEAYRLAEHDAKEWVLPAVEETGGKEEAGRVLLNQPANVEWVDKDDRVVLWPGRAPREVLETFKQDYDTLVEFDRAYRCRGRSLKSDRFDAEWMKRARELAREMGIKPFDSYRGPWPTFTGVDLAGSLNKKSRKKKDTSAFFTLAITETGKRVPIDVEYGLWRGPALLDKIQEKHDRFGSIVRVETNALQSLLVEFARDSDETVPIRSHQTGNNKWDPQTGVSKILIEVEQGAWAVPTNDMGQMSDGLKHWESDMLDFDPEKHTGDVLMACWIAMEQARESGAIAAARARRRGNRGGSLQVLALNR